MVKVFHVALMMKLALGSNNVLGYMHICICISKGRLCKAQTFQGWPKSFLIGCDA